MNKIIITGATGFLGSHIVEEFCRNGEYTACLARRGGNVKQFDGLNIELKYGDVCDKESLKKAFRGYDCVIHNAACVGDWADYNKFYETNVEGTVNVLEACRENAVRKVVMTGSVSSYGEENSEAVKDENCPYKPHYPYFLDKIFPCRMNYYRDTKAAATREAVRYAKEYNLNLIILEPVWIFGEREFNTGFYEYIKSAKKGMVFAPGSRKNRFHVVYAGDAARAFYSAFKKDLKGVHRIIIGNTHPENMDKIYDLFCGQAGVKKPDPVPKFFIYPVAFLMELLYTIIGSKNPPLLTRGRVNMFYDSIGYSCRKAVESLGFEARYTLEEGIKKTVSWYKQNGYI